MPETLDIETFLDKHENERALLIDVRSEKEFGHARIPGAVNIPLLNNEHRHLVGIDYKKNGRESAVALGFELVGPHFHEFIKKANEMTDRKEALIYCWRGGMRSSIMSWILTMAGFKTTLLKGGYKSFRNYILSQFKMQKKIVVVGGQTGSGKTELLNELAGLGEQVIDLEKFAHHRGSAFGQLGLPPQPSIEFFENILGCEWRKINSEKIVWIEGESRSIGQVKIPDDFFDQLQSAPLVEMICSKEFRKERIMNEYGVFPKKDLAECTIKLRKRLGNLRMTEALSALDEQRMGEWLNILIDYYDKAYTFSLQDRKSAKRIELIVGDDEKLSDVAKKLVKLPSLKTANSIA